MNARIYLIFFYLILTSTFAQNTLKTVKHDYDANNQLTKTVFSNGKTYTYIYDELGNRTQKIISISCVLPTAFLSGSTTIENGQGTNLELNLAGTKPYNLVLDNQWFSDIQYPSRVIPVSPTETRTYSVSQITNACGLGTAHGSATITVVPRLLRPDIIIESFDITQYSEKEILFSIRIKNIGEKSTNMENFNLKSFVSPSQNLQTVGGFNNSWTLNSIPELGIGEEVMLFLKTNIDYNSNQHYYIFLPDFYNYIEESNETNNQKAFLVKKCTNPNNDVLSLTGNLDQQIYFGKTKIEIKDANVNKVNTLIVAPQINGLPNFSVGQNNVTFISGTCVNPEVWGPNDSGEESWSKTSISTDKPNGKKAEVLKLVKPKSEKSFLYDLSTQETVSVSLWEDKNKIHQFVENEAQIMGLHEYSFADINLNDGKDYWVSITTTNRKYLIKIN